MAPTEAVEAFDVDEECCGRGIGVVDHERYMEK